MTRQATAITIKRDTVVLVLIVFPGHSEAAPRVTQSPEAKERPGSCQGQASPARQPWRFSVGRSLLDVKLLDDQVGNAAEHEHCRDSPQNKHRHGTSPRVARPR
jgi:hypothetical protein